MENNFDVRYMLMKHQLEFFYHIPVDQIVTSVMKELSILKNTPSILLETIFKHVFEGAKYYYDFIDSNNVHTFFNEDPYDKRRKGLCGLIFLSLQNNCILDAFFDELAYNSNPITISGKNQPLIEKNIMNLIFSSDSRKLLKGETQLQQFNNRKNIFKHNSETDIYINRIVESLNIPSDTQKDGMPIETLQYVAPVANFLFAEDTCTKFGHSLIDKKNILQKYGNLAKVYYKAFQKEDPQNDGTKYSCPIDQLIFESEMEAVFGFSFFRSISSDLERIHMMSSADKKSLKDLEGQQFIKIILQAANLPLFFDKMLFYRYICYSYSISKNIDYSYFNESAKEIATMSPGSRSKFYQVNTGLDLMHNFLRILSSVSIPLLYSLWKTVIHELDKKGQFAKLKPKDMYTKYLTDNYYSLTYDYGRFTDEELLTLGNYSFGPEKKNSRRLCEYIKDKTANRPDTTKNISKDESIFPKISKDTKNSLQQLILSYCNIDSLREMRFPFFFLRKEECAVYSPLSKMINSLQYYPEHIDKHEYLHKKDFLINYRKILFRYLCSEK